MAGKRKIPKNLSDREMMTAAARSAPAAARETAQAQAQTPTAREEFYRGFLPEKTAQRIGELLLAVKMEYYRDEIVDFGIEVRKDGRNIVLVTVPKKTQERI